MPDRRNTIVFVYPNQSSFTKNDVTVLKRHFNVLEFYFPLKKKLLLPFYLVKQFVFLIVNTRKARHVVVTFGGFHSWLPVVVAGWFGKKSYIMVHGTDCCSFPELNYGDFRKSLLGMFLKKSYKKSSMILPVSESLIYNENTYYSKDPVRQGIKAFIPGFKTPYKVIPNGCELEKWEADKKVRDPKSFVTVVSGERQFELKGVDLIIALASDCKDCSFHIVGLSAEKLGERTLPENVTLYPFVPQSELRKIFSNYTYYMQLYVSEGFGLALCEAMLCNMIPIVSNVNALPAIVGDAGFVLNKRDVKFLKPIVNEALSSTDLKERSDKARAIIVSNYSLENREQELVRLFNQ